MSINIKMVNLTINELRLTAGRRNIKNYRNMSKEKLWSTLAKAEYNFETISHNKLEQIAKMENLSQNILDQITEMLNLSQNELEQIANMRRIKNYNNMSKEELELLVSLLKSNQSLAERLKK